ncbi:RING-H2 finger protein ATL3-like [Rhodamnia argentea]|uniref:RING-type E3 ubiquitin transferase n=1 Tax=Rhodamnia argentea TaxID=178133 RepID=A0A8B8PNQ7_9MYRT|nr:RING-H2 finger protein ATL3-like [Rhodamnia argentea]
MGDITKLDDSEAVALTGKIMLIAVTLLFIVVLFVLLLHLYAKWFWGRVEEASSAAAAAPPPRRRRSRRFVFAPGQDPTVAVRTGLDPKVLLALPVVVFNPQEFKEGLECAVCLSELVQGERARILTECSHGFHVDCIDMWFQSHSTCPLCRKWVGLGSDCSKTIDIDDDLEEENSDSQPVEGNLSGGMHPTESPNFPTNVLFWGNEMQVSSGNACLEEGGSSSSSATSQSSSSSAALAIARPAMVVIDMPRQIQMTENPLAPSSSANRVTDDDLKSPVPTRLRSLKRLLSRDRRVVPCSANSLDVE